ncbi:hypothetical protein GQ600_26251 [Phytophthora cactorum]|nr:hypothetical protein GQ600_26251 [Phytophthora cactorum]
MYPAAVPVELLSSGSSSQSPSTFPPTSTTTWMRLRRLLCSLLTPVQSPCR